MYIDPKSEIAGYPALAVRRAMKHTGGESFSCDFFAYYLKTTEDETKRVIIKLVKDGYLEKDSERKQNYRPTIKGNALAMASAAKPISRKTADKKLAELMQRAKIVNSSNKYLYLVKRISVFGSYLTDKEKINDIDLDIELESKYSDLSSKQRMDLEAKHTEKAGKCFSSLLERLDWPTYEVKKYLKSRSRALSLHYADKILKKTKYKIIFESVTKMFK